MSALALGILSLFLVGNSQAALLNGASFEPSEFTRVDGEQAMSFSINFTAEDDDETISEGTFVAVFGEPGQSWSFEAPLTCQDNVADCEGDGDMLNGTWATTDLIASDVVSAVGNENIWYGFKVTTSLGTAEILGVNTNVEVNTLPILSDDAAVTGVNMPYSERTISITYTDADDHDGVISVKVCEDSDPTSCETDFNLAKEDGEDNKIGAVYSGTFTTAFGGALTATVTATDGFDPADDEITASFIVDKDKPWLVNAAVSTTSANTSAEITFSVV